MSFIIFLGEGARQVSFFSTLCSALLMGMTIWLTRRGLVDGAGWLLISAMFATLMAPIFLQSDNTLVLIYLTIPVLVSGLILRPWQVWMVALVALLVILGRVSVIPVNEIAREADRGIIINTTIALVILGAVSQLGSYNVLLSFRAVALARDVAENAAAQLAYANSQLERQVQARTIELQQAFDAVQAQSNERQALLDQLAEQQEIIREMSVPVLPVGPRTLVMPLIGALDTRRLHELQLQALAAIEGSDARTLLIDLTGVPVVDTQVAQGLIRTIQAVRLLGAHPVLIGIRPEVAQSIVSLGIDLSNVRTVASLASALAN
ncbi:MAG: STAS domain-containing protein [Oscillochloris sp.]|nr:STAS domain-containing protein [Oscillochloris sp.]